MTQQNLLDLYRYEGEKCKKIATQLRYILFVPGFQYTFLLRRASNASCMFTRFIWSALLRICMYYTNIQIPAGTQIGEGFMIGHWGTIIINPAAKIGKNFSIAPGCLIGNSEGCKKGTPTIGNNVKMGTNAIVIGNIKIEDNVLIAPGAFINFDVPKNSIVIGNPGKIIPRDSSPTAKYIVYSIDDFK